MPMQTNNPQLLTRKEMYSTIRFIALEYCIKNGHYSKLYLYIDSSGYPIMISPVKINYFNQDIRIAHIPAKLVVLYCLYNEYPVEQHLGILIHVTRLLERKSELNYAKQLGMDVSTYRLLETQHLSNKGLIKISHGNKIYQFTKDNILSTYNIPITELNVNVEEYYER